MTTSLATIFVVVWSLLASMAIGFAQEFENFPDAEITSDQWQQRVQDARRRSEQFVANARTQVLGACPNSHCSILSESDSSLGYEQVFSSLEYRSDAASAAECAGLRAERPCLAVYR
jgi:hypothetical protein